LAALPASAQAPAGQAVPAFKSIELRGGGTVTVRHGPVRRVTVRSGGAGRAIRAEGDKLVIDRCHRPCPAGHRIDVEIVTPAIAGLAVTDGGLIQLSGSFPPQAEIAAAVSSGGTVDMRPLVAARVAAAVSHGGGILASAGRELAAAVSNGGIVTYWGDPKVASSIRHGGAVVPGKAADLARPLARLDPGMPPPPLPPLPPVPARGH
ncbi:MAG TPA: hypothetical protein VEA60_16220, partial [Allosphingosinicella sp.]|nr:hypothetical protein [Allosphingosinicella sp.]